MRSFAIRTLGVTAALLGADTLRAGMVVERSVQESRICRLVSLPATDLVVIDSGFEAGLRQGMVCTVSRGGSILGELLLVDLRLQAANALILDLASGQGLRVGDLVAVKTVSSRK